jgi:hypothetical protein
MKRTGGKLTLIDGHMCVRPRKIPFVSCISLLTYRLRNAVVNGESGGGNEEDFFKV